MIESDDVLRDTLACIRCHGPVVVHTDHFECAACRETRPILDGIVLSEREIPASYFDTRFQTMQKGNREPGVWSFCYEQQTRIAREAIRAGDVVLDIGCGPELCYERDPSWRLVGVDPSFASLKANDSLDFRVCGSAEALPLRSGSVDAIVCFYSVHHMVGSLVDENREKVSAAVAEFGRVLKKGGQLLVFDMSPWWPVNTFERLLWNNARRLLGPKLDMYFWHHTALEALVSNAMPGAALSSRKISVSPLTTFPPAFGIPALRVPRFLYPFDAMAYQWRL